jgi:hypothetical protein
MIPPEASTHEKLHVNERAAPASTDVPSTRREQSHIELSDPQPQESSSYEPAAKQPEPQRLHKLLPRPFNAPTTDTSATRERIAADHAHVRLSAVPYSYDVAASTERTPWALVTYIAGNPSYPTAKEKFVDSVKEAIEGKLAVNVSVYQCADPSFALQLPIIANDHEVILMFVDAHLQTTLATLLESVPSYARSPLELESPFMCLGSVHERALRGLILHATTHEDQSFKGQLWRSLKALATHSSHE